MDVTEAAIGLDEFTDTCLGMADDFGFLAGDASCGPGLDVGGDRIPNILLLQDLNCRFPGGVGEAVDYVEDSFPEGGRHPRSRSTRANIT